MDYHGKFFILVFKQPPELFDRHLFRFRFLVWVYVKVGLRPFPKCSFLEQDLSEEGKTTPTLFQNVLNLNKLRDISSQLLTFPVVHK